MVSASFGISFELAAEPLVAMPSGALFLPSASTLIVADLHLGKAERAARRNNGFWPPYEAEETLARLRKDIEQVQPQQIIALGDSFDDGQAVQNLAPEIVEDIKSISELHKLIWVAGNHDPAPHSLPGECVEELRLSSLTFRHIAEPQTSPGEVSGHYHPKLRLTIKGRWISRKCFLLDKRRLILPAYGAYTGGLDVTQPPLSDLVSKEAATILTGAQMARIPLSQVKINKRAG